MQDTVWGGKFRVSADGVQCSQHDLGSFSWALFPEQDLTIVEWNIHLVDNIVSSASLDEGISTTQWCVVTGARAET